MTSAVNDQMTTVVSEGLTLVVNEVMREVVNKLGGFDTAIFMNAPSFDS